MLHLGIAVFPATQEFQVILETRGTRASVGSQDIAAYLGTQEFRVSVDIPGTPATAGSVVIQESRDTAVSADTQEFQGTQVSLDTPDCPVIDTQLLQPTR